MKVDLRMNTKGTLAALRRFGKIGIEKIKAATNTAAILVQSSAKARCAVDTGRLRSSIAIAFLAGGLAASVGTDVVYGPAVEFGHGSYTVTAKGKALRWIDKRTGKPVFAKSVKVPARPARPFLYPAWAEIKPVYLKLLRTALVRAAEEAAA